MAIWATRSREHPLTVARQLFGHTRRPWVAGPTESIVAAGPHCAAMAGLAARPARPSNREVLRQAICCRNEPSSANLLPRMNWSNVVMSALNGSGTGLLETVDVMFDNQGVLEQAAKALPVHVNTPAVPHRPHRRTDWFRPARQPWRFCKSSPGEPRKDARSHRRGTHRFVESSKDLDGSSEGLTTNRSPPVTLRCAHIHLARPGRSTTRNACALG